MASTPPDDTQEDRSWIHADENSSADLYRRAHAEGKWSAFDALQKAQQIERGWSKRVDAVSLTVQDTTFSRKWGAICPVFNTAGRPLIPGHKAWAKHRPPPIRSRASLRHALKRNELVREQLGRWWAMVACSCYPPGVDGPEASEAITYVPFLQFMLRVRRVLLLPVGDLVVVRSHAEADWERARLGYAHVSRHALLALLFELADGHTQSCSAAEYAAFLALLFDHVSSGAPPTLKPLAEVTHAPDLSATAARRALGHRAHETRELAASTAMAKRYGVRAPPSMRPSSASASPRKVRRVTRPLPFSLGSRQRSPPQCRGAQQDVSSEAVGRWSAELDTVHTQHAVSTARALWKGGVGLHASAALASGPASPALASASASASASTAATVAATAAEPPLEPPPLENGSPMPRLARSLSPNQLPVGWRPGPIASLTARALRPSAVHSRAPPRPPLSDAKVADDAQPPQQPQPSAEQPQQPPPQQLQPQPQQPQQPQQPPPQQQPPQSTSTAQAEGSRLICQPPTTPRPSGAAGRIGYRRPPPAPVTPTRPASASMRPSRPSAASHADSAQVFDDALRPCVLATER